MLKLQLTSALKDIKNPERRVTYIALFIAVGVLFGMLIRTLTSSNSNCETKSAAKEKVYENKIDSLTKKNNDLTQANFNITLQSVIDKLIQAIYRQFLPWCYYAILRS